MRLQRPHFRFSTGLLAIMAVLLGFKLADFVMDIAHLSPNVAIAEDQPSADEIAAMKDTPATPGDTPEKTAASPATKEQTPPVDALDDQQKTPFSELAIRDDVKKDLYDVTEFSASELGLLQSLRERREELRKREATIDQREKVLKGMEIRLQNKVDELNAIKGEIEAMRDQITELSKKFEQGENKEIQSLVALYEKMKPKDAAQIFDNLNLTILMDVVKGMKESKLALIVAAMDPKKATELSAAIGTKTALPTLASQQEQPADSAQLQ